MLMRRWVISGMHYTGMQRAAFTPFDHPIGPLKLLHAGRFNLLECYDWGSFDAYSRNCNSGIAQRPKARIINHDSATPAQTRNQLVR
jgi:hypothetical protein